MPYAHQGREGEGDVCMRCPLPYKSRTELQFELTGPERCLQLPVSAVVFPKVLVRQLRIGERLSQAVPASALLPLARSRQQRIRQGEALQLLHQPLDKPLSFEEFPQFQVETPPQQQVAVALEMKEGVGVRVPVVFRDALADRREGVTQACANQERETLPIHSRPGFFPDAHAGVREHQAVTWAKRLAKCALAAMVFNVSPSRNLSENTSRVTASKERPT